MKRIIIFGASGRVGQNLCQYALEEGYHVTAFVRRAAEFGIPGIRVTQGDSLDFEAVHTAIAGQDYVVSALGTRNFNEQITLMSESMKHILLAMHAHQVRRVLAVGGMGVLQESITRQRRDNPAFPAGFANVSNDHQRVYRLMSLSGLDWTFVCPPHMPSEKRTGEYQTLADYHPENGLKVSAEDVADFLLREIREQEYVRKRVGIAY
jgi:uncharacterized protein